MLLETLLLLWSLRSEPAIIQVTAGGVGVSGVNGGVKMLVDLISWSLAPGARRDAAAKDEVRRTDFVAAMSGIPGR